MKFLIIIFAILATIVIGISIGLRMVKRFLLRTFGGGMSQMQNQEQSDDKGEQMSGNKQIVYDKDNIVVLKGEAKKGENE